MLHRAEINGSDHDAGLVEIKRSWAGTDCSDRFGGCRCGPVSGVVTLIVSGETDVLVIFSTPALCVVIDMIRERKRLRLAKSQEMLEEKIQQPAE